MTLTFLRHLFVQVFYVGGPNQRKDYHLEEGEELFYMRKGDMVLKILENGKFRDLPIKEGDVRIYFSIWNCSFIGICYMCWYFLYLIVIRVNVIIWLILLKVAAMFVWIMLSDLCRPNVIAISSGLFLYFKLYSTNMNHGIQMWNLKLKLKSRHFFRFFFCPVEFPIPLNDLSTPSDWWSSENVSNLKPTDFDISSRKTGSRRQTSSSRGGSTATTSELNSGRSFESSLPLSNAKLVNKII